MNFETWKERSEEDTKIDSAKRKMFGFAQKYVMYV